MSTTYVDFSILRSKIGELETLRTQTISQVDEVKNEMHSTDNLRKDVVDLDNVCFEACDKDSNLLQKAGQFITQNFVTYQIKMDYQSYDEFKAQLSSDLSELSSLLEELSDVTHRLESTADSMEKDVQKITDILDPSTITSIFANGGKEQIINYLNGSENEKASIYGTGENALFSLYNVSDDGGEYSLSEKDLNYITKVCLAEQEAGGQFGVATEASFIANKYELAKAQGAKHKNIADYVENTADTSWWAGAKEIASTGRKGDRALEVSEEDLNTVKDVLCNGKRILPKYVDEHDFIGDISSITTDGVTTQVHTSDTKEFPYDELVKDDTAIEQGSTISGSSTWYYTTLPSKTVGDPYGYTGESKANYREKYDDYHVDYEAGSFTNEME